MHRTAVLLLRISVPEHRIAMPEQRITVPVHEILVSQQEFGGGWVRISLFLLATGKFVPAHLSF
jgi:hypothetical protein